MIEMDKKSNNNSDKKYEVPKDVTEELKGYIIFIRNGHNYIEEARNIIDKYNKGGILNEYEEKLKNAIKKYPIAKLKTYISLIRNGSVSYEMEAMEIMDELTDENKKIQFLNELYKTKLGKK